MDQDGVWRGRASRALCLAGGRGAGGRMSIPWLVFREVCVLDIPRERLTLDRIRTPLGQALLITDANRRLRALDWEDHMPRMQGLLRLHYGSSMSLEAGRAPRRTRAALDAYFAGGLEQLDGIACHTGGTSFQRAVWAALRAIPPGRTMSYGALAAALGVPKAVRAVGRANGANPIGVVVPSLGRGRRIAHWLWRGS